MEKDILFSTKNMQQLTGSLGAFTGPATVAVLGVVPALVVTVTLKLAVFMSLSMLVVLALSSAALSHLSRTIPTRMRVVVQLVVVSVLVILVHQLLQAFAYDVSRQLSVFVALILTNSVAMGHVKEVALRSKPWPSFRNSISSGLKYGAVLVAVGFFRELLGLGTLWGFRIIPDSFYVAHGGAYENNGLMVLPPMALLLAGVVVGLKRQHYAGSNNQEQKQALQ
ncbi:MAG: NADH:ubiquinone reductase (Na(+)-transporting) subunit D [Prevotellaceae bacterium]|jgi:Na+-transporting NADH:ubiquinone oxidoreductase subunit D|nr:NADH:ubiquinone reductase (Na(+)-transporting) subunit D [Prevotellaceae bacterium]